MDFQKEQEVTCPECGKVHKVIVYERIMAHSQPELKKKLLTNELFKFTCEDCQTTMPLIYPCLYQDMDKGYMIWFAPASNGAMQEKIAAYNVDSLLDDKYKEMNRRYKLRMVTSVNSMIEKILIFDEDMDDRSIEVQKVMLAAQVQSSDQYNKDAVRAIFFEVLPQGGYAFTLLFEQAEPYTVKLDMEQYYRIYTRNKNTFEENTPEGFSLIQTKWGVEQFNAMMRDAGKAKGKRRKRF